MTPLRQRMTEDMQVRNLSPHTQTSYLQQVSLFARHFNKSPEQLGPEDIRAYQVYLTNERKLSPSSILIAVSALRFLYKVSLKKDWTFDEIIPAPKKPQMDLSPILRQTVKTQTSSNGELSHGIITKAVHQGVQAGRREAAGARRVDGRSSAGVGGQSQRVAALASGVSPRCGERVSG